MNLSIRGTRYKRYRPAEYSDRVINLNKLEDRNLDHRIKQIEKENRIGMNNIIKDIKKLESELEFRREALSIIRNKDKLKKLSSTLSDNLLNSEYPHGHINEDIDTGYEYLFRYNNELSHSDNSSRLTKPNHNNYNNKIHTSLSIYNRELDEDHDDETNTINNRKNFSAHGRLTNHYIQVMPEDSSEPKIIESVRVKSALSTYNTSNLIRFEIENEDDINNNYNINNDISSKSTLPNSLSNTDLNTSSISPDKLSRNVTKLSFETDAFNTSREKTSEFKRNINHESKKLTLTTSSRLSNHNDKQKIISIPSKQNSSLVIPVPVIVDALSVNSIFKTNSKTQRANNQIQTKPVIISKIKNNKESYIISQIPNQQLVQKSRLIPSATETRLSRNRLPKPNVNDEETKITKYMPLKITNLEMNSDIKSLIMPNKIEKTSLPQLILKDKRI